MNKLEQKIYDAWKGEIPDYMFAYYDMDIVARIAAKIALEIAEKAYNKGHGNALDSQHNLDLETFEDFKQEILYKSCEGYPNCDCSGNCLESKKFGHPHE